MRHLLSLSKHGPFSVTLNNYHHLPKWIALGEIKSVMRLIQDLEHRRNI